MVAPNMKPTVDPTDIPARYRAATSTPFGRWLLAQEKRDGWIGGLAKCAKADRAFPKDGDPEAVRERLTAMGAESDMFEALDDAEMQWLSY